MIQALAPAKVILFGEHAVVYDKLGIAAAVNIHSHVSLEEMHNDKILVDDTKLHIKEEWKKEELLKLKKTIDAIKEKEEYPRLKGMTKKDLFTPIKYIMMYFIEENGFRPFKITLNSKIPMASGLGSGSSIFASCVSCLRKFYGLPFDKTEISELTYQADVVAHGGTPSGIDNNTVTHGGYNSENQKV